MSDQTRKIQQIELDLFKEFKRICDKHHLRYFAIGGTCIGAVRHKGFIPWDDDIDVAMPYQDYKKFQKVSQDELQDNYSIYVPECHRHWHYNFMKLQNDCTTFIESFQDGYVDDYTGIYMDIMPIYGMPRGKLAQYFASVICDLLIYLNAGHRQPFCELKTKKLKIVQFFNAPIRKLKPYNYYIEIIEKIFGKYSLDCSDKILFGWRYKPSIFRKKYTYKSVFYFDDFKEMLQCPFEDVSIAIPCGYDRYLTMDFGNYMELPPKDKRVTRHKTKVIDLNKSYKDYAKEGIPK